MNNITSYELRQEIHARFEIIGIDKNLGSDGFIIDKHHPIPFFHDSYCASNGVRQDIIGAIKNVESIYGVCVYCVICNKYIYLGKLCTFLTISPNATEWEMERSSLSKGMPFAYVENLTYPAFSEWGTVVLKTHDGIVERIG